MFCAPTEKNFDTLAGEAATSFMGGNGSLTDNVVKIASAREFNPEECKRLTEKANTAATIKMLNVSLDKRAEIELADIDAVLKQTHGTTAPAPLEKNASEGSVSLPVTRTRESSQVAFRALEKTAGSKKQSPSVLQSIFKTRQSLSHMRREKLAAEIQANEQMDYMLSEFSKLYGPDFSKFASEAYTLHGESAAGALTAIGKYLRTPPELTKVAHSVDDTSALHGRFSSFMDGLSKIAELGNSISSADQELNNLWKSTGAY